ncbi:MAG: lycopene cyclase, partial [Flavisolibacter sp.]|nr:lycopene cyclase [Flavisolibacter sp.]
MATIPQYDYIITGAGCAGLSLAMHLVHSNKFGQKKILIVDKEAKNKNDRTWCFWEKEEGLFQPIVFKQWNCLNFFSDSFSKPLNIHPYQYKLIRGIDFYTHCIKTLKEQPNITFVEAGIDKLFSNKQETGVIAEGKTYTAQYIFNSLLFSKPELRKNHYWLLQHFKGWLIKTAEPAFDPSVATLMDFRTDQSKGTTFFYVLPFSATEALVEYTLFSEKVLSDDAYEEALKEYIEGQLKIKTYEVKEKEFGIIPMTNFSFPQRQSNIINIGTAGG